MITVVISMLIGVLAILIFASLYVISKRDGHFDLFSPISLVALGFFLIFIIRPLILIYYNDYNFYISWDIDDVESVYIQALLYSITGWVFFFAGYSNILSSSFARALPTYSPFNTTAFGFTKYLFFVVGLMFYLLYVYQKGGSINILNINDFASIYSGDTAGLYYLRAGFGFFVVATYMVYAQQRKINMVTILLILLTAYMLFAFRGRKFPIIYMISVMVLFYYKYGRNNRIFIKTFLLSSPFFIIATIFLKNVRSFLYSLSSGRNASLVPDGREGYEFYVKEALVGSFNSAFDYFCLLLYTFPSKFDFLYFHSLKSFILSVIPRALFPDKPTIASGRYLNENFLGDQYTLPPAPAISVLGELYVNGGWMVLSIGMFFIGIFFRIFYLYSFRNRNIVLSLILYTIFFKNFFLFVRSGFFSSLTNFMTDCLIVFSLLITLDILSSLAVPARKKYF